MGASASLGTRSRSESNLDVPPPPAKLESHISLRADSKAELQIAEKKDSKMNLVERKDSKIEKEYPPPSMITSPAVEKRRMSLQELMTPAGAFSPRQESIMSIIDTEQLTVGDIVLVTHEGKESEGIVVEKVNNFKLRVDFGERVAECLISECALIIGSEDFEVGDKVEARPDGSALFFVGKVVKIHPDKSMDILMDGDDLSDIERNITRENCRKLMSRRSVVVNRWKRAFMMVVAANFFKRITFMRKNSRLVEEPIVGLTDHAFLPDLVEDEKLSV